MPISMMKIFTIHISKKMKVKIFIKKWQSCGNIGFMMGIFSVKCQYYSNVRECFRWKQNQIPILHNITFIVLTLAKYFLQY